MIPNPNKRLLDIDRAKGLAISLVVIGHVTAGDVVPGNEWFGHVVAVIYSFHMPFFMYLSGFVMYYSFRQPESLAAYGRYVKGKASRLAPGFIFFALLILLGKSLAVRFLHVDNMPSGNLAAELLKIFVIPGESSAKTLWFIYVLLEFYIIFPILLWVVKSQKWLLIAIGLALHFLPATRLLMISDMFEYFIYFAAGVWIAKNWPRASRILDAYRILWILTFLLSFSLLYVNGFLPYSGAKLVIGLLSIPALHSFMRLSIFWNERTLLTIGSFSFVIYLMNTITIGVAKGSLFLVSDWSGPAFFWFLPILFAAGLWIPILVKKYLFPRIPPLDRITS